MLHTVSLDRLEAFKQYLNQDILSPLSRDEDKNKEYPRAKEAIEVFTDLLRFYKTAEMNSFTFNGQTIQLNWIKSEFEVQETSEQVVRMYNFRSFFIALADQYINERKSLFELSLIQMKGYQLQQYIEQVLCELP